LVRTRFSARAPESALRRSILAALLALSPVRAAAHEPPKGKALVWPGANASGLPLVVTNRGLISAGAAGTAEDRLFKLRCNEAYDVKVTYVPFVALGADADHLLVTAPRAVLTSSDGACSFEKRLDVLAMGPGGVIGGIARSQANPGRVLLSTIVAEGVSGVWASEDGGESWSLLERMASGEVLGELLPAPSNPSRFYGLGTRIDLAQSLVQYLLFRSDDGGQSWDTQVLDGQRALKAVHPTKPDLLFIQENVDQVGSTVRLLRSEDAGKTFLPLLPEVTSITGFASNEDGSSLWFAASGDIGGLFHSSDGGKTFTRQHEEFASLDCVGYHAGELWLCGNRDGMTGDIWVLGPGASAFEPVLAFTDVRENQACGCEADPVCRIPWLDWKLEIFASGPPEAGLIDNDALCGEGELDAGPDAGSEIPKRSGDCALHEGPTRAGLQLWLLALLGLVCRRVRKRVCST
jgi:hypothetical protein